MENLQIMKEIASVLAKLPSRDEFSTAIKQAFDVLTRLEVTLIKKIEDRLAQVRNGIDGKDGKDGKQGPKGDRGEMGPVGRAIFGAKGDPGAPGKDGSPDTPEQVRDKLESIKIEDEKLAISAVAHLREELDKLDKKISSKSSGTAVFASQRGQVKAYDLSASLNGVLKTFTLPAFWRVISVHLSSTPNILRETIDYTTDASASSITFTSQIDAASSLSAGQSLIIVYAEP